MTTDREMLEKIAKAHACAKALGCNCVAIGVSINEADEVSTHHDDACPALIHAIARWN